MDDKMTVFGDWPSLNPSPRTFMSNFLNEEFGSKSFPDLLVENESKMPLPKPEKQKMSLSSDEECGEGGFDFSSNISLEPKLFDAQKSSSRGGLAQRIARAGFHAPTINTDRIKSANMNSSSLEVHSSYLTIPSGLSPTTLLDSPVFLSNSMVQPSPTTGKFSFSSSVTNSHSISASDLSIRDKSEDDLPEDVASGGFSFKPHLNPTSLYFQNTENKISSAVGHQPLQNIEVSRQKDFYFPASFSESVERNGSANDNTIYPKPTDSIVCNEHSPPLEDQPDGEGNTKGDIYSTSLAAPAEDGYNWRKYGQKQVKGSEFPRSYYKCTHPNCQVKKKVERSLEGHITEIIYKGAHNHAKPLLKSRSGVPPSHPFNDAQANLDDLMDATLSNDVEAIDVSSSVSKDEEEDGATHGSVATEGDGVEDESESKRRKLDECSVEMNTGSRAAREPRVVVQTTSEVDILDDGYRWRKYGQKVVKGNPNPRSYYKCTNPGCTVRKHVERASHDLKSVITTYEGKHNHDVPAARNSSHSNSAPSTASTAQRRLELIQDGLTRFDSPSLLSAFSLPGFAFGVGQSGLSNLGIGGMGQMGQDQIKMPPHLGPLHANPPPLGPGLTVPKGEPKEEPMEAYHQLLMSRLPLGPQM